MGCCFSNIGEIERALLTSQNIELKIACKTTIGEFDKIIEVNREYRKKLADAQNLSEVETIKTEMIRALLGK